MTQTIHSGDAEIHFLDDFIAVVETASGIVLDAEKTRKFYDLIEQHFTGDYSLIINRKNKYRLMRFEVYKEANQHERLKAIAIVSNKPSGRVLANIEEPLSQKPFSTFKDLDEAVAWIREVHKQL